MNGPKFKRCSNCIYWNQSSKLFGKCSKIGIPSNLRFAYEPGIVFAMTPRFGMCDNHEVKPHKSKENENENYVHTNV